MASFKELFDKSTDKNDNKYTGGAFSITENLLLTNDATIPLSNISKIWVSDISKRVKLSKWFWICGIIGILGLFSSLSSCASGLTNSGYGSYSSYGFGFFDSSALFLPSILLLGVAAALFAYYHWKNNQFEYALCIESNSGSVEMYTSTNTKILYAAQIYLEKGIKDAKQGITISGSTFNVNNGNISNDVIVHGNNYGSATTGYNNNMR